MPRRQFHALNTSIGGVLLQRNEQRAELILSNNKSFSITLPESAILESLISSYPSISTKESLISSAWGSPDTIGPNSLPVAITNLRKVLKLDNINIVNTPRVGYKIDIAHSIDEVSAADAERTLEPLYQADEKSKHKRGYWFMIVMLLVLFIAF